jgi:S-formylglutathione hydrolase FrmB
MKKNYLLLLLLLVIICSCSTNVVLLKENKLKNNLYSLQVQTTSFHGNLIDESDTTTIYIYLPPSYNNSKKRYPVIYYLHGFGETPGSMQFFLNGITNFYNNNQDNEMIFVSVDGKNNFQGSFYVNSPVTGNWEDYFLKDIIPLIDKKYRTIATADSRGISGFSMGGYASINLALKHPDIFSSLYSLCPGLFDENGLVNAMDTWDNTFIRAYGSAFSPNLNKPELFDRPLFDGLNDDQKIVNNWNSGFGHGEEKINSYLQLTDKLNAIRIDYGKTDFYKWIPQGCVYFLKLLDNNNINYESDAMNTGHSISAEIVEKNMMPFFAKNLKFKD